MGPATPEPAVLAAFRQTLRRGHPYALVPWRLVGDNPDVILALKFHAQDEGRCGWATPSWLDVDEPVDPRCTYLCLLARYHPGDCGYGDHDTRRARLEALVEQLDPVKRIERRALAVIGR